MKSDVFDAIEKHYKIEFAPCVKSILKSAAYDTEPSLSCLNSQQIFDIENYINEFGKNLIVGLQCCNSETYRSQERFRFLPGHKGMLLSIPAKLREMNAAKKVRKISEFKKLQTPADLAKALLVRLNSKIEQSTMQIGEFNSSHLGPVQMVITENSVVAKCTASCTLCGKPITLTYDNNWRPQNMMRHFELLHFKPSLDANETIKCKKCM